VGQELRDRDALLAAVSELGEHVGDRRRERELAAVDAHEDGGRRERLGDGEDREDVVGAARAGARSAPADASCSATWPPRATSTTAPS
jgi:hypothetical protein